MELFGIGVHGEITPADTKYIIIESGILWFLLFTYLFYYFIILLFTYIIIYYFLFTFLTVGDATTLNYSI